MKIDIFNHFYPRRFFDTFVADAPQVKDMGKRVRNIPTLIDLDARFRMMDEFGDFRQVISLPTPPLEQLAGPDKCPLLAKVANDGLAELVQLYPDRFPAFVASLPMSNPEEAAKELERSTQLGAKGVQILTNVAGKPLDSEEFRPLFDEIGRRDVVVWLHPARGTNFPDYSTEDKSLYEIWWTFGWPYETSVAMARLVFSGLFDRWPNFKIITHHMGAMIPYFEGRVGYGWDQLGTRTSETDYTTFLRNMKKRPIDYFRMFYADTALFGALAGTRCGLEFFGVDHVLFASDAPFEPSPGLYARETIRVIESLGLSAADKDQIYRGNAERLLRLSAASAAD
ncbi:MAG: amidohydrolase family protein [Bryobacteraceae bacterium]|jgi:aminocarboxymuconate-semialdehyde decarboxylase